MTLKRATTPKQTSNQSYGLERAVSAVVAECGKHGFCMISQATWETAQHRPKYFALVRQSKDVLKLTAFGRITIVLRRNTKSSQKSKESILFVALYFIL